MFGVHIPTRHKAFAGFAAFFTADKTFDMAREHLFLAAHEALTHAKLLSASMPIAAAFIGIAVFIILHRPKGE